MFIFFIQKADAQTPAGTPIFNQATASYLVDDELEIVLSNMHTFNVDEIIDLTLTFDTPVGVLVSSPDTNTPLKFTLTNTGNGVESFALSITQEAGDDFEVSNIYLYFDANANGVYDDDVDILYEATINEPELNPGEQLTIFVLSDIPSGREKDDIAEINLSATSTTGNGVLGDTFEGLGDKRVDVLLGPSGGSATVQGFYVVGRAVVSFSKTQSVDDGFGGNNPIQNAIITYTITMEVSGFGDVSDVNISDAIPAGTTYRAGTLKLDNKPLTDALDADEGIFTGSEIQVS